MTNPFFPTEHKAKRDCVWVISAPEDYHIVVKFDVLDIDTYFHTLSFGLGSNPENRTSTVARRYQHTELVLIESNLAWLRFGASLDHSYRGFALKFITMNGMYKHICIELGYVVFFGALQCVNRECCHNVLLPYCLQTSESK